MNEDDILETALNSGIDFSAKKHNVDPKEVYRIVKAFQLDNGEGICSCEMARRKGNAMFCFMCDGGNRRIHP